MRRLIFGAVLFLFACQRQETVETPPQAGETLFTAIPADYSGIDFVNQLEYDEAFNVYTYRNFYNGGGVGLGDVNNDGLVDLFFCGNMAPNRLYLNKGNFQFVDITEAAGVASEGVWSSGVSFADVNGDGWLDIYVCKSGSPEGENRHNELFINDGASFEVAGGLTGVRFTERAAEYGVDDLGLSTHAVFFDYDKDNDLDCYLLNNSIRPVGGYDLREGQREIPDPEGGNKLYRNDGGRFTDVSQTAGIYSSAIGFGLGVTIGDVNRDGWQDIYVSNDFFEKDYLYINQQNGAFREELEYHLREISLSSMGADMADLNNDGYPEIFVTDMLPEQDARLKTKTHFENWDKYQLNLQYGYFRQFTRNVLQRNLGPVPGADRVAFSEVGRFAGVYATDWSWGALIADLDNDGRKDIFVANGIYKDLTDQDYINFYSDPATVRAILSRKNAVIKEMIDAIPSQPLPNYAFANQGGFHFENKARDWGLDQPSFSNGSAYGDLDNDGDLDLVINNTNMPPFLFRNESRVEENRFLTFDLRGEAPNTFALGAQVTIRHDGRTYYQELAPMRGFQSCVDRRLHFGLGALTRVDTVEVRWPDGRLTHLTEVPTNQRLELKQSDAQPAPKDGKAPAGRQWLERAEDQAGLDFVHRENPFSDFDRDRLLYHMVSAEGPPLAVADVNADGRADLYIGGAKGQAGALYLQGQDGSFRAGEHAVFAEDQAGEDTKAIFFDADGNGAPDLYVAGGSYEFPATSSGLKDRLYFNDGRGRFRRSEQILPAGRYTSTGAVAAADYDGDGDLDLFVGSRLRPFLYGAPAGGYLLANDGAGRFTDVTQEQAPALAELGMTTAAVWFDGDGDGDADLMVAGDWGPLRYFRNEAGRLTEAGEAAGLGQTGGLWRCLQAADLDGDGDTDLVAGNHGWNTRLRASPERPLRMVINDFDRNGSIDHIITVYEGDQAYPLALRHDLVMQLPTLKKKYLKYANYREQTLSDVFTEEQLDGAIMLKVETTASMVLRNRGDGFFEPAPLPDEAQLAPVNAAIVRDIDRDGTPDLVLGGNFYRAKPEIGIHDASYGLVLRGTPEGGYEPLPPAVSGLFLRGEVRDMTVVERSGEDLLILGRNNQSPGVFVFKK